MSTLAIHVMVPFNHLILDCMDQSEVSFILITLVPVDPHFFQTLWSKIESSLLLFTTQTKCKFLTEMEDYFRILSII